MAEVESITERLANVVDVGQKFICTDEIDPREIVPSPTAELPNIVKKDRFILDSKHFVDLQIYLQAGMKLPDSKDRFEAIYPETTFSAYLSADKTEPSLYKALRDVLVKINNHCTDFSRNTMEPMISLGGYIANFATLAESRSHELRSHLDALLEIAPIDINDPDARDKITETVDICRELSEKAKKTSGQCIVYRNALTDFKLKTQKDKTFLEEVNVRSQAVLPTAENLNQELRAEMKKATDQLKALAQSQNEKREKAKAYSGCRWYYFMGWIGVVIAISDTDKKRDAEFWLNLHERDYETQKKAASDKLLTAVAFREKSENLTRSMQTVLTAIQKAIDALQQIMGAFSTLETDLDEIADRLDSVTGNVTAGAKSKLRRALRQFNEACTAWAKVLDLAKQFQRNGLVTEVDPKKLAEEHAEDSQDLEILGANFGASDCTDLAKILFYDGTGLRIPSVDPGFPDPWYKMPKSISILHQYRQEKRIFVCKEDTGVHYLKADAIEASSDEKSVCRVIGPCAKPAESTVEILAIVYGPEEVRDAKVYAYCYSQLEKEEKIHWTNENFGGDTWVGEAKTGTIYYTTDGGSKVEQCMGRENERTEWKV